MEAQLHLLSTDSGDEPGPAPDWRLDESTRALGRRGVADARSALRAAMRHRCADASDEPRQHPSAA
jgi:hypothetical protein